MILKIERLNSDFMDYTMFDNITKIDVGKIRTEEFKALNYASYYCLDKAGEPLPDQEVRFITIVFNLSNGERHSVVFDTNAYICNDAGKTLEKIVCN